MTYRIERFPNEPIILVSLTGNVDANVITEINAQTESMIAENPVNSVMIFDTTLAEADFRRIMEILRGNVISEDANAESPPFTVLSAFVGTSAMVKLYIDGVRQKQFGGQHVPLFATLDDALVAMRLALAALPEQKLVE